MQNLQLQSEETLRSEHVTSQEAELVVKLWAERQREEASGSPTIRDLAEGLEIPPEQARRLLAEVRSREASSQQQQLIQPTRRLLATKLLAVGLLAFTALLMLILLTSFHSGPTPPAPSFLPPRPPVVETPVAPPATAPSPR